MTAAELAGSLSLDWAPFQQGLDAALAYAQAWAPRANAALTLQVTVNTTGLQADLAAATAGLDAVRQAATTTAASTNGAAASGATLAKGLADLATQAQAAGTGVSGLGTQTLRADEALAALEASGKGAGASMDGFAGGASTATLSLQQLTARIAATDEAIAGLTATAGTSAEAAGVSAQADQALVNALLLLDNAERAAAEGADLAAAANRNYATTLTAENEQIAVATANLNANAEANERDALAMTQTEQRSVGAGYGVGLLAIGLGYAGVEAIKMGADFDATSSKLVGFAGVSAAELDSVKAAALDLSRQTGASAQQIVEGFYYAKSAGLSLADAMTVVNASTRLALAGFTDSKTVVDITTSAMRAYGVGVDQLAHIQDVLTATTTAGKLQFGELASTLGKDLSIAATAGISLEQVGASIATMTQKGIAAAQATTAFRAAVLELIAPSTKTAEALASIGLSADDVLASIGSRGLLATLTDLDQRARGNIGTLHEIFTNVRALSGVLADVGTSTKDYQGALDQTTDSQGRAATAIATYAQTSRAEIGRFVAGAKADFIELGSSVADGIAWFLRLPPAIRDAAVALPLAGLAAVSLAAGLNLLVGLGTSLAGSFTALAASLAAVGEAEGVAAAGAALLGVASGGTLLAIGAIVGVTAAVVVGLHAWVTGNEETGRSLAEVDQALQRNTTDLDKLTQAELAHGATTTQELTKYQGLLAGANDALNEYKDRQNAVDAEMVLAQRARAGDVGAMQQLNTQYGTNIRTWQNARDVLGALQTEHDALRGKVIQAGDDAAKYSVQVTELQHAQEREAAATLAGAAAIQETLGKYNIATNSGFQLAGAKTALIAVLKQEADGTLSTTAVNQAYQNSVAALSLSQADQATRIKALADAYRTGTPDQQANLKLQQDMDKIVGGLPATYSQAVLSVQALTAAAGVQSGTLVENAGHLTDLEAVVGKAKQGGQQALVVEQELAEARHFASQSQDQQHDSLVALQLLIDTSTGSTKAHYEELLKLDLAYAALTPDAAAVAVEHQHLADTFGFAKGNAHDLNAELPGLIQGYHDGAISVHEFGQALLDLTSKPTQAELDLTVQLDAVKGKIADLNKELANGSYAEKHIADLEKVVLQDQATGASTDKLQKDQAALAFAMDNVKDPANRQGKSLEDLLFNLENQQKGIEGNLNSERAHRQSLEDTTKATVAHKDGSALSLDQIQKAYDAYATGAVGALQGVANKAGPAGKQVGEDNTRELAASMGAGLATLNDTLATLPAKLAQALTDPAHFNQAGTQNAASHGRGLLDGLDATKTDATNAAALLAGSLELPDVYAAAGHANAAAFAGALVGDIRAAMQQVATIASGMRGAVLPHGGMGGFTVPTTAGTITQAYGPTNVAGEPLHNGQLFHEGLDIGIPIGTQLVAGRAGTVTRVLDQGAEHLGLSVTIDLGNGITETLGHLSDVLVKEGQQVTAGQTIAKSGSSGFSSGPHTHVEFRNAAGEAIDPATILGVTAGIGESLSQLADDVTRLGQAATTASTATQAATAATTAYAAGSVLTAQQIAGLLSQAGATPEENTILTAIALWESGGGNTAAVSSMGAQGLFQFMPATAAGMGLANPYDPAQAAAAAVRLARQSGYSQWDAYDYNANYQKVAAGQGAFTTYLPQAQAAVAGLGAAPATGAQVLPGELPVAAAPDAATAIKAENTALSDLDQAIGAHNTILQQQRDLQGQVHDGYVQTTIDQLTQAHSTTESARATAAGLLTITDAAQQEWQASVAGFDPATKASRTYTQAEIENARLRYVEAKRGSDAALAVFKDDLQAEQQAARATEAERAAMAAAARQLAAERRGDLKTEADLVSGLATTYRKFLTDVTEISATAGPHAGGIFGNSEQVVQLASNAAGGAAQAYHDAEARVLADEQALTGAMGSEDRKRLQDQLDVDKASAGDVLQTAKDEAASFGLIEDAFHQMVTNMQAASRARMNLDAFGFSDFTDAVLKSVNLPVDAQTIADEARLREARMTWEMMVADSQAASQQLIRDLANLNAATDPMERARAQAAVNADQARISSDQAAMSAIAQDYGKIQTAVQDDMHREIDAAKTAAQAKITSYETARDALIKANDDAKTSADNLLRSEEQDLDASLQKRLDTIAAADTAEKASIDTSAQQRIDAIQGQLDAEQRLKEHQQLTTYQGAVRTATSPEERRAAEAQLADFQMQLHDRMLQDQIKAIQHAAEEQKKAADLAAKTQTDTAKDAAAAQKLTWENQTRTHKQELDKQTAAVKDFYNGPDGLITQQQRAIKALEATSQQHYRAQETDAVTDAKHLLSITSGNQQDQVNAITAAGPLYTQAGQAAGTDLGKGMTMGAGVALTAAGGALLGASTSLFTGALSTGVAHGGGGGTLPVDSPWLAHIGTVLTDMAGWMSGPGIKVQPVAPVGGGTTSGGTWNITIPVYQQPGQDARALAMAIRQEFEVLMRDQMGRGSFLGSVRRGT